jgi:ectoine hydroxylase-related dioxygenase (phytanoyl-CoA dioxygenase family)
MFSFPEKLPPFFIDPATQRDFEVNGFAVVDFYNSAEIDQLNTFFQSIQKMPRRGFFPTTFFQDKETREQIHEHVVASGKRAIDSIFKDIRIVHGSFIIKNPDKESELRLHQDMSLVDESKYAGVNIWVPLIDLTTENGALYVLPGSHRIFPTYRGASIPNMYDTHTHFIKDYLTPLYLKAGQAVIFDQSIIHYSPPNRSGKIRITTNIFITQQDAKYRMYYYDKTRQTEPIEIFEQADDFMSAFMQFGYDIYARPEIGRSLGFTDYNFPVLDELKMAERYGKPKPVSLLKRITKKIKDAVG